jgi:hypothetical protein
MIEIPPSWTFANQTIPGIIRSTLKERFPPGEVRKNPFTSTFLKLKSMVYLDRLATNIRKAHTVR